jgi:lipopolysaccharide assembly outer membrane protein LptD (OstA)
MPQKSIKILYLIITIFFAAITVSGKDADSSKTLSLQKESDSLTASPKKKSQDITDTIYYLSDYISYDAEEKILHLAGKAEIKYQNMALFADTIFYSINNNLFTASGSPQLIEGKDTTYGDFMVYNIKTRRGRVRYASTHLDDGYFTGQNIIKSEGNELFVDQGDYTTCAHIDTPHYYFYGQKIKLIPKDKIIAKPIVLNIGDAPVAVLPYFIFPLNRDRRSGFLTPAIGGNFGRGGYIENIGYYLAPNDYVDFLFRSKVAEFNDFVMEIQSRYAKKYLLDGSLSARYAYSRRYSEGISNNHEFALNYYHNQNLTPDGLTKITGTGNLITTKNFFRDFSEDSTELVNQKLTANLSLSRRFEGINASANLNWVRTHDLQTDNISEDLPSFNFSIQNRPLIPLPESMSPDSSKWYNSIFYNYSTRGIVKHTINRNDSPEVAWHPGMNHSFSINSTQKLFKYINLTPSLSVNMSSFYGYTDTAVIRYDTLKDTITYRLSGSFRDTRYDDYSYPVISRDTISTDQRGNPDTIEIRREHRKVTAVKNIHESSFANDFTWQTGVNLSTNLYGLFPIRIFNFAGLRHTLSPSIGYRFVPKHDQDKEFFNIGIPYYKGRKRSQLLDISVSNQFDGKILKEKEGQTKPEEHKFHMLSVNMSTSYDFEKESRKWSDLNLDANTTIKGLNIRYSSSFWFYDENNSLSMPIMKNMNISFSTGTLSAKGKFWDGDLLVLDSLNTDDPLKYGNKGAQNWQISISPSYSYSLKRDSPGEMFTPEKHYSLSASASLNFTRNWSMSWNGTYNFNDDQWSHNSFTFRCDLECWDMFFQWRPEKINPGFYFKVNIKKIPEIKWEQRQ